MSDYKPVSDDALHRCALQPCWTHAECPHCVATDLLATRRELAELRAKVEQFSSGILLSAPAVDFVTGVVMAEANNERDAAKQRAELLAKGLEKACDWLTRWNDSEYDGARIHGDNRIGIAELRALAAKP